MRFFEREQNTLCREQAMTGSGEIFGGVTVAGNITIKSCDKDNSDRLVDCKSIIALETNNNLGYSVGANFIGKRVESKGGASCGTSCSLFTIAEVKAIGEVSFYMLVGGVFDAKFKHDVNSRIADRVAFGDKSCSL